VDDPSFYAHFTVCLVHGTRELALKTERLLRLLDFIHTSKIAMCGAPGQRSVNQAVMQRRMFGSVPVSKAL
jgi:hypothetical protein